VLRIMSTTCCFLVAACSGRTGGEPIRPHGSSTPDAAIAEAGPSEKDCETLLAHVIALGAAETKSDPQPSADDVKTVAGDLSAQFMPGCRASTRAGYRCAVDAKSLADVAGCKSK
jgi:hypothetical protein